jgi:MFS superfamily sulfate permease-like transporter
MGTLIGVLGSGLLRGVMFGALISLIQLIRRAARPHIAVLGRIPGTSRFSDMQRHPENEPIRGGLLVRPQAGLVYFNIGHVCDTILERTRASHAKFVVLDLSAAPYIDLQSAEALATLADELLRQGTTIHAVDARAVIRDRLRLAGAEEKLGGVNRYSSIADVVGRYEAQPTADTAESAGKP